MLPLQEKRYTIEDIEALPEGRRAELIDGKLYMMAAPTATHQRILMWLGMEIGLYLRRGNGGCEVFPAPFAVFLNGDEEKYFEPDISVICDRNKIDERGCHGAPDWIINPMNETILVYGLEAEEAPVIYRFEDRIKAGIYSDLEIDFSGMKEVL